MTGAFRVFLVALPLLVAQAGPAPAQVPGAADDARAAVREFMEVADMSSLFERTIQAIRPQLVNLLARNNPAGRDAVERAVEEIVVPAMIEERAAFLAGIEAIYVRHFTAAELRDITGFYRTPAGRKSLNVLPQIQAESMAMGSVWGERAVRGAIERNAAELRRRGINL